MLSKFYRYITHLWIILIICLCVYAQTNSKSELFSKLTDSMMKATSYVQTGKLKQALAELSIIDQLPNDYDILEGNYDEKMQLSAFYEYRSSLYDRTSNGKEAIHNLKIACIILDTIQPSPLNKIIECRNYLFELLTFAGEYKDAKDIKNTLFQLPSLNSFTNFHNPILNEPVNSPEDMILSSGINTIITLLNEFEKYDSFSLTDLKVFIQELHMDSSLGLEKRYSDYLVNTIEASSKNSTIISAEIQRLTTLFHSSISYKNLQEVTLKLKSLRQIERGLLYRSIGFQNTTSIKQEQSVNKAKPTQKKEKQTTKSSEKTSEIKSEKSSEIKSEKTSEKTSKETKSNSKPYVSKTVNSPFSSDVDISHFMNVKAPLYYYSGIFIVCLILSVLLFYLVNWSMDVFIYKETETQISEKSKMNNENTSKNKPINKKNVSGNSKKQKKQSQTTTTTSSSISNKPATVSSPVTSNKKKSKSIVSPSIKPTTMNTITDKSSSSILSNTNSIETPISKSTTIVSESKDDSTLTSTHDSIVDAKSITQPSSITSEYNESKSIPSETQEPKVPEVETVQELPSVVPVSSVNTNINTSVSRILSERPISAETSNRVDILSLLTSHDDGTYSDNDMNTNTTITHSLPMNSVNIQPSEEELAYIYKDAESVTYPSIDASKTISMNASVNPNVLPVISIQKDSISTKDKKKSSSSPTSDTISKSTQENRNHSKYTNSNNQNQTHRSSKDDTRKSYANKRNTRSIDIIVPTQNQSSKNRMDENKDFKKQSNTKKSRSNSKISRSTTKSMDDTQKVNSNHSSPTEPISPDTTLSSALQLNTNILENEKTNVEKESSTILLSPSNVLMSQSSSPITPVDPSINSPSTKVETQNDINIVNEESYHNEQDQLNSSTMDLSSECGCRITVNTTIMKPDNFDGLYIMLKANSFPEQNPGCETIVFGTHTLYAWKMKQINEMELKWSVTLYQTSASLKYRYALRLRKSKSQFKWIMTHWIVKTIHTLTPSCDLPMETPVFPHLLYNMTNNTANSTGSMNITNSSMNTSMTFLNNSQLLVSSTDPYSNSYLSLTQPYSFAPNMSSPAPVPSTLSPPASTTTTIASPLVAPAAIPISTPIESLPQGGFVFSSPQGPTLLSSLPVSPVQSPQSQKVNKKDITPKRKHSDHFTGTQSSTHTQSTPVNTFMTPTPINTLPPSVMPILFSPQQHPLSMVSSPPSQLYNELPGSPSILNASMLPTSPSIVPTSEMVLPPNESQDNKVEQKPLQMLPSLPFQGSPFPYSVLPYTVMSADPQTSQPVMYNINPMYPYMPYIMYNPQDINAANLQGTTPNGTLPSTIPSTATMPMLPPAAMYTSPMLTPEIILTTITVHLQKYFSTQNIEQDSFFHDLVYSNNGDIPLETIMNINSIHSLTSDTEIVLQAIRNTQLFDIVENKTSDSIIVHFKTISNQN